MKTLIIINLISLIFSITSFSQAQFQRTVGGTNVDNCYSMIQTTDGGYALAGYSNSFGAGSYDMYIVKLDVNGSIQWSKTIGGTNMDIINSVIQTTDGGFALAGYTQSFGAGSSDMYIVKLDGSGTLQWSKTLGGTNTDIANSIIQTTDGGYAIAGYTNSFGAGSSDMYIVKLDASGSLQWSKTLGGTNNDYAISIIHTIEGGYALAGYTNSFGAGNNDMYLVKLNASGTLQWSKTVGGTNSDYALAVVQSTDGGYTIAGYTNSFGAGDYDMYIAKLDSIGSPQGSITLGGINADVASSIIKTTDGGYALTGYTQSYGSGNSDMYLVKLDAGGSPQWSKTVGGTNNDNASSIIKTTDGGYAIAGLTQSFGTGNSDIYFVKLSASGNICGNSTSPSSSSLTNVGSLSSPTPTINLPIPTSTSPTPTINTGGTLTSVCLVGIQTSLNEVPSSYELYQNYPNPFNPSTKIKFSVTEFSQVELKVYDVSGKEVSVLVNEEMNAGVYEAGFNAMNLTSGVYFYTLKAGAFSETRKMMLVK